MGGLNAGTCPPASSTQSRKSKASGKTSTGAVNPVRFHEVTQRGEVDFHDDKAGFKCAVDSAAFFTAYTLWRLKMSEEMTLSGQLVKDGETTASGHATVTFLPYVDDAGNVQVSMIVSKTKIGQSVLDLDILAHFS